MLPIRRYLLRRLAWPFLAMALVAAALAWVGFRIAPATRYVGLLWEIQLSVLVAASVLLLAFSIWRMLRLAREFVDKLAIISASVEALGEGRLPGVVDSEVAELHALGEALHKAGRSIQNETELRTQLERSRRLETMGCLAGGIAHDVNNQLASIVGQINLGKDLLPEGHPALARMGKAEDAADRCAALVKSLLGFTHQVRPQLRSIDLNALVSDTASLLDRVLGGLIRIELSLAPGLPPILGNQVQLEQILMNLAVNSRDAMPHGGHLRLATEAVGPRGVRLTVRDTGTGIPQEIMPRIFEPFFTTK
ncbi:MAG TPA: ATP-binding protein, partial [Holophaga sp.]|nr:ATP-binding protein [Holophaga sp.]